MADKGSLVRKYGVEQPGRFSSVVDGLAWEQLRLRRRRVFDVTQSIMMMVSVVAPIAVAGAVSKLIYEDVFGGLLLAGLTLGVVAGSVGSFLYARAQWLAVVSVHDVEVARLHALLVEEFGAAAVEGTNAASAACLSGGVSWSSGGVRYSVNYDETSSRYSLSSSSNPQPVSSRVGGARRLLQLI